MSDFITNKVNGNTVGADEWNQLAEIDTIISTSGQTPATTTTEQASRGIARYASGSDFYTDGGSANSYVLTSVGSFKPAGDAGASPAVTYFNGMRVRFRPANTNTGASTINVNSFGSKAIKKRDGTTALTGGEISGTRDLELRFDSVNDCFILVSNQIATTTNQGVSYLNNPITIANNSTNPNTQMDIGAGIINYDTGSGQLLCQAITKTLQSSGSWTAGTNQNGLDTGARANSTWYQIFEIVKNSDNTSDILYSTSRTSPTIPSGYTLVAWIGAIRTDGSGNIDSRYFALRTRFGQIARFQTGLTASGTTTIPEDNTIPQITEGDEYMALQIIPLSASSRLEINAIVYISNSAATPRIGALFQDSTANCLVSGSHYDNTASAMTPLNLNHSMVSGATSATTIRFRAGGGTAGTTYFNGISTGQLFGGTMGSSITIKEYY